MVIVSLVIYYDPMSSDIKERLAKHRESELHGHKLGPYIQDIVYGGHDGIITTFAVVAGTAGADLPHYIVIILGLANLFADAVSMGAGAFLSLKSELDHYFRLKKEELQEIDAIPDLEREEVREAYESKGFKGQDLERVVDVITSNKEVWAETMMLEEHGLTEEASANPLTHGIMTFVGFVIFGIVPLFPYLFGVSPDDRFPVAIAGTFAALALLGGTRSFVTRERLFRGAIEIVAIGALTATVAYGIGVMLKGLVGVGF